MNTYEHNAIVIIYLFIESKSQITHVQAILNVVNYINSVYDKRDFEVSKFNFRNKFRSESLYDNNE